MTMSASSAKIPAPPAPPPATLRRRHLLGIQGLSPEEATALLDRAETFVSQSRQVNKKTTTLRGRTLINLFFESSTRTQSSFEIAAKRLGADTLNMSVQASAVKKGETLLDTAATLNAMRPDMLVVRHQASGAVELLARKVGCSVINAGDGSNEHPTQALLDALTVRRRLGRIAGLRLAICGDILHSRVARSNIYLFQMLGAEVRVVAPVPLLPAAIERLGVSVFTRLEEGLEGCDVVMTLRLQRERMGVAFLPSTREYFHFYGIDAEALAAAKPGVLVMHPGPMNRGVEIDSQIADDVSVSLIQDQVEMGVAMRMAVLEALSQHLPGGAPEPAEGHW
ncbi:MAG: aspartate carbamoyltransferase catalytic subunit [Alphaproteobacteria bacterium]|nr:aspartate carbamoyltransferase catalytic subunit [Alphaproteobacteria bacterium]